LTQKRHKKLAQSPVLISCSFACWLLFCRRCLAILCHEKAKVTIDLDEYNHLLKVEEKSKSISTAKAVVFNPAIPVYHSISGIELQKRGWVRMGSTYTKDGSSIAYDGASWVYNGEKIQFIEEIK